MTRMPADEFAPHDVVKLCDEFGGLGAGLTGTVVDGPYENTRNVLVEVQEKLVECKFEDLELIEQNRE